MIELTAVMLIAYFISFARSVGQDNHEFPIPGYLLASFKYFCWMDLASWVQCRKFMTCNSATIYHILLPKGSTQ
jgi:hypothetical protein